MISKRFEHDSKPNGHSDDRTKIQDSVHVVLNRIVERIFAVDVRFISR